jgi:hypothetical protein
VASQEGLYSMKLVDWLVGWLVGWVFSDVNTVINFRVL